MTNTNLTFDWQIDEFMVFCRSEQLREKTMNSYEQALLLSLTDTAHGKHFPPFVEFPEC